MSLYDIYFVGHFKKDIAQHGWWMTYQVVREV